LAARSTHESLELWFAPQAVAGLAPAAEARL
jgi:hypothetical protein